MGYGPSARYWPARIIARMAALIAPGSPGQASTTAANSGSIGAIRAPSAPHSAPLCSPPPRFPEDFDAGSIPAASTKARLTRFVSRAFSLSYAKSLVWQRVRKTPDVR